MKIALEEVSDSTARLPLLAEPGNNMNKIYQTIIHGIRCNVTYEKEEYKVVTVQVQGSPRRILVEHEISEESAIKAAEAVLQGGNE